MVKTRFAPSPTGYLHLGGARTAIFNWLFARHHGGRFLLRIEDTDRERSTEESVKEILEAMRWLGMDWDEGPFRQTERMDLYKKAAQRLLDEGKAYYCYCTPEELESMREEALAKGLPPRYDGRCRDRVSPPPDAPPPVIRFKVPQEGEMVVHDLVKGDVTFPNSQLDDFIIVRSDGTPTYNFVVVVDDAEMGLTHVIRGDDHLNNTPKQILLYEALGYDLPQFAHVSMILGPDHTRLSKRHGATSVLAYRDEGYLPEALFNFLVRLGWSHGDQEVFTIDELIEYFDLDAVSSAAAVYNPDKLLWLNAQHMKMADDERLADELLTFLEREGVVSSPPDKEWLKRVVASLKERAKTLKEMAQMARFYFEDPQEYDEKGRKKFLRPSVVPLLRDLICELGQLVDFGEKEVEEAFVGVLEKHGLKLGKLAQPVRVAITGGTVSPGIFEVVSILGKDVVLRRLNRAVDLIEGGEE
jgi:glutamyl-tRNA synthetase